jgi:DNA-binding transcriptional ArsR family regulator
MASSGDTVENGDGGIGEPGGVATGPKSVRTADFSRDVMLEVLSNRRRRFTIHYLKQQSGGEVTVSELADRVASWENGKEIDRLSHRERKRVRNALRQFHLPKLAEHGFVEFDSKRGTVRLTEAASSANFYVDSLTGGDIPWGVYYLGLSTFSTVGLLALWAGVFPVSLLSPFMFSAFLVAALAVSSIGHFYDNYCRMRLGARDRPPEVDDS